MSIVQILGVAPASAGAIPLPHGTERWCMNNPRMYRVRGYPDALTNWTRWFNLHSKAHILGRYPDGFTWYQAQDGSKPIYLRDGPDPTVQGSLLFPGPFIQTYFGTIDTPETFFTCSATWLMALAIMEGFHRIELWGHAEVDKIGMAYWIGRARQAEIDVFIPPTLDLCRPQLYGYQSHPGYDATV